jgi:type I restriction enzyme, S subunit
VSFTASIDEIIEGATNHRTGKHTSWERVRLGEIASIRNGFPFESSRFTAERGKGYPLIRIRDLLRSTTDTLYVGDFDASYVVNRGDLLVGMDGDFNSAVWLGEPGLLNQRVCKIAPHSGFFDDRFLAYCLPGYLKAINAYTSSLTVKHLSSLTIAEIPLPLPPLAEQTRIADALDELLSGLDAGVAALERAQTKLDLYRASVLRAAVEGALTAEWRQQHLHTDPASELLEYILAERRREWEEDQLRKFEENGQAPPKNWKEKFKEPPPPDSGSLAPLPNGWCWTRMEQLCGFITKGTTPTGADAPAKLGDVPFIKVQHLSELGAFHFSGSPSFVSKHTHERLLSRSKVLPGDVLMNIVGPPLGQVSVVPADFPEWNINQAIAIFSPVKGTSNRLLAFFLRSIPVMAQALKRAKTTAGQVNLTLEICRDLCVPLPPVGEQEAIVEAVEDQLSVIDHLENEIDAKLAAAQALRHSILRHAFTGQLVPQDPNDEPASELLKRIASERGAAPAKKKVAKVR